MKTLLIVEDDTDIQDYYQILLSGLGLRILCAYTGKEGLVFVDAGENIDLILRVYAPDFEKMKTWTAPKAERVKSAR